MSKRWYVVQAYSGFEKNVQKTLKERIAREQMEDLFGQILVPVEEVVDIKNGRKTVSERKFFPGYVLVEMEMTDDSWHLVKSTPRVNGFIGGTANRPLPITQREVDAIMAQVGGTGGGGLYRPSQPVPGPARYTGATSIEPAPLTTSAHVIKTSLPNPPPPVETLLKTVLAAVEELKAKDVVQIDVRGKSSVCDFMVIASGTSTRHVKSIADEVVRFAKKLDVMPLGVEGEREAEWVLVDLGDVIVHVMLPRVREFYALERLWTVGDQPPESDAGNA